MIVTIDGPAGAGKSTVAKALALRLGFQFLDTGAMYRAVTYAAIRDGIDLTAHKELARFSKQLQIELRGENIFVAGEDVSQQIRTVEITSQVHYVADNSDVRQTLVELQRTVASGYDIVTEGRDQGTIAFPDAACKIFLTASAEERAQRRLAELNVRGQTISLDELLAAQKERDARDKNRECGPLVKAEDAVVVCTDDMTFEEVVDYLESLVRQRLA